MAGTIVPNTTLNIETSNNTSAASSFSAQTNGNAKAGNVSNVSIKKLLYSGATTKVYAHLMVWFGSSNHMNVGYASNDASQVRRQVNAMATRGIDGVIIDWYGRNRTREDQATLYVKEEGERLAGKFKFAIMEDKGALRNCEASDGCNVTSEMISDLNYAYSHYMTSPAYMRIDGRPVIFFFGVEDCAIDWNRVRANVMGNPVLIRQNRGGFFETQSNGSFAWAIIDRSNPNNFGSAYLDNFYSTAVANPAKKVFGATYKGFNDSLAAWHPTPPRVMNQNCGQTWLATWDRLRRYYSTARQLPNMQMVTWNDYEEGTALEVGIDNCVRVSATTSGTSVAWTVSGARNTIDHFTVFVSIDGTNLMRVSDVPASSSSLDLRPWAFAPGTYSVYVKAVGKSLMLNKMSAAANLTIAGTSTAYGTSGVSISSPLNNANTANPVHVAATAKSDVAISAMHVYVDGVKLVVTYSAKVDSWLNLKPGARNITVQAWDVTGRIYKTTVTVNVQ